MRNIVCILIISELLLNTAAFAKSLTLDDIQHASKAGDLPLTYEKIMQYRSWFSWDSNDRAIFISKYQINNENGKTDVLRVVAIKFFRNYFVGDVFLFPGNDERILEGFNFSPTLSEEFEASIVSGNKTTGAKKSVYGPSAVSLRNDWGQEISRGRFSFYFSDDAITHGLPHAVVDLLATHPKYQRRGLGTEIVKTIVDIFRGSKIPHMIMSTSARYGVSWKIFTQLGFTNTQSEDLSLNRYRFDNDTNYAMEIVSDTSSTCWQQVCNGFYCIFDYFNASER